MSMSKNMKAQSAMEYLMTYGWAILIVIIVAAALYALGIFDPSTFTPSTAAGFTGFQVPTGGWSLGTNGDLTLIMKNMAGARINVTSIEASLGTTKEYFRYAIYNVNGTPETLEDVVLSPNGQYTFKIPNGGLTSAFGTQTAGSSYSINVKVDYINVATGLPFGSTGTLTGSVS